MQTICEDKDARKQTFAQEFELNFELNCLFSSNIKKRLYIDSANKMQTESSK